MEYSSLNIDWRLLVKKYSKSMCFYAMNYLKREDAEDIVQDVFSRFWEKKENKFPNEQAIKTYLFNSVRNACLDKLNQKVEMQYPIDYLKQEVIEEEILTFDEQLILDIKTEIMRMPEQTRNIIICVFMRRMKYQEVANELGISINTVKTLLANGLKHLRSHFSHSIELIFWVIKSYNTR